MCIFTDFSCEEYQFKCLNNKCIRGNLKCNGKDDCGDNSDEGDACKGNNSNSFQCLNYAKRSIS